MITFLSDSVVLTRTIVEAAVAAGVDKAALLSRIGCEPALLADPDARVPTWAHKALLDEAVRLTGDAFFGLRAGAAMRANTPHVVHYLFSNSPTLREGIRTTLRYSRLMTTSGKFTLTANGDDAVMTMRPFIPLPVYPRQPSEWGLAIVATLIMSLVGEEFRFREAHFQHKSPGPSDRYEQIFKAPVRFGQRRTRLLFGAELLDHPCATHDPALQPMLERMADYQLRRMFRDDVVEDVRIDLQHSLSSGGARIEDVCARLGLHKRTLQRRLVEQGTSFKDLLDVVRREMVDVFLREESISIGDTAFMLGFEGVGGLYRAFRRWHGMTPTDYRAALDTRPPAVDSLTIPSIAPPNPAFPT